MSKITVSVKDYAWGTLRVISRGVPYTGVIHVDNQGEVISFTAGHRRLTVTAAQLRLNP